MQINIDWRPDTVSLLLGLALGVGLAFLFIRLLPTISRYRRRGRGWVESRISWMRSGVEVRFQSETAVYAQKQHLGVAWARLDQIFVPPHLLEPVEEEALADLRGATPMALLWPELAARISAPLLPAITPDQLLQNGRRVIISGAPGSGKTMLLAHLAHRLASAAPGSPDKAFVDVIPVFLHLAEIEWPETAPSAGDQSAAESDPISHLAAALQKRSSPLTSTGIVDMLRRKLEAAQVMILLDGWNELPALQRPPVIVWLRALLALYPKTPIFATTALEGYGDLLALGFNRTLILPWRIGQVQALLARWTAVLAPVTPPSLETIWQPGQTPLQTSLRLWLASLPDAVQIGSTNADLWGASLALFQPRKKGEPLLPPDEETVAFWQELAFSLIDNGCLALPGEKIMALAMAQATAPTAEGQAELDKSKVGRLRKSLGQNHLFVRWGQGQIGIRCTAFRDYLAGLYLAADGRESLTTTRLPDERWRGVWPHYAAVADPSHLATTLLQMADTDPARDGWFHIAAWLPQTTASGNWRRQVMINLGQMARQSGQPEGLRLRAIAAMAATGEEGLLTFVKQLLGRSDPFSRQMGTAVLPLVPDETVISLLAERLADEDLAVQLTAVSGLALLQHNPLTEHPLVTALIGDNEEVSLLAAEWMAHNGGPGIDILREAVKDEDIQVRRAAVHGLALLDEDWIEPLLADLERNDSEWFVRSAASGAAETIRRRRLPQPWRPLRAADQPWLANMALTQGKRVPSGQAAVTFVLGVLNEATDSATRVAAIRLLAQLPAREAMPILAQAIEEADTAVREAAFLAWCTLRRAYGP